MARAVIFHYGPPRMDVRGIALFAIAALALGCTPVIGDPCVTSLDCSQLGDRLCDASQPLGYCTIFNCEPDKCPDGTLCLSFGDKTDPACTQYDPRWARFERSFCMAPCTSDDDCRAPDYVCVDPASRRSLQIDTDPDLLGQKACFPKSGAPTEPMTDAPSCTPPSSDN
jgi:hypothetical protein